MNSFEQQGADWEKQITLLSGRPPAKVSQSQTTGCCLHSCRPFLLASRTLTALSKNIPPPTFSPHHLFYVVSNHLSSPPPKKNYPHYFVFLSSLLSPLPEFTIFYFLLCPRTRRCFSDTTRAPVWQKSRPFCMRIKLRQFSERLTWQDGGRTESMGRSNKQAGSSE